MKNNNCICHTPYLRNSVAYKSVLILVDNDVNKVHRKFPIDTCLICLKFFPAIRCYYSDWFSFYFTCDCQVHLDFSVAYDHDFWYTC